MYDIFMSIYLCINQDIYIYIYIYIYASACVCVCLCVCVDANCNEDNEDDFNEQGKENTDLFCHSVDSILCRNATSCCVVYLTTPHETFFLFCLIPVKTELATRRQKEPIFARYDLTHRCTFFDCLKPEIPTKL